MAVPRGMQAVITAAVFNALSLLFILVRCVSRFLVIKKGGAEDYLIIFAQVLACGLTATIVLQQQYGLGQHIETVSLADLLKYFKVFYASALLYNTGLFVVKASILHQYLRFFVQRSYRLAATYLLVLVSVAGTAMVLTMAFSCTPVAYFWDRRIEGGHCINLAPFGFVLSGFHIVSDLAVWLLPMPVLKNLQLPRKQKATLMGVFALGGFACITGILRLHALYIVTTNLDLSWNNLGASIWSVTELNVGIMCACVPAMRPAISLVFPRLLSTTHRDHSTRPYPRRSTSYYPHDHDSIVELSQIGKARTDISRDEAASFDTTTQGSNTIQVKQEWTITERDNS